MEPDAEVFRGRRIRAGIVVAAVLAIVVLALTGGESGKGSLDTTAGTPSTSATATAAAALPAANPVVASVAGTAQAVSPTTATTVRAVTATATTAAATAPTTARPATATTAAGGDPLLFRRPLNGNVNISLKWDCYDCVDWPTLRYKHHPAIDYTSNDPAILATADGVVVKFNTGCGGQGCGNSLGNWLFLKHTLTDGSLLYSFYAHMAKFDFVVAEGVCVKTGQRVGTIGNTGIASPAHLHFSIQSNTNLLDYTSDSSAKFGSVDPDTLFGKKRVVGCS